MTRAMRDIRMRTRERVHRTFRVPAYLVASDGSYVLVGVRLNFRGASDSGEDGAMLVNAENPTIILRVEDFTVDTAKLKNIDVVISDGEVFRTSGAGFIRGGYRELPSKRLGRAEIEARQYPYPTEDDWIAIEDMP